jgi:hypothetical protein
MLSLPRSLLFLFALICTVSEAVWAVETRIVFGVNATQTDNSNLVEDNALDDSIYEANANVQVDARKDSYVVDLDYYGRARRYQDETQDDENLFTGRSFLRWNALQERLNWDVLHVRGDILRDARLANTANNREVRDVFVTGPDLVLRLSPVDSLVLRARYTDIGFELSTDSDNERKGGQLLWTHNLSRISDFALDFRIDDAEYDAGQEQRFTQLALIYEARLRTGRYRIRIGYNEAESQGGMDFSGPLFQFNFVQEFGLSNIELYYQREFTDTSLGLIDGVISRDDFRLDEVVSANFTELDLLEQQSAFIRVATPICRRCDLRTSINYNDVDYKTLLRDESSIGAVLSFRYNLNRKLDVLLGASLSTNEYTDQQPLREDDITIYSAALDYRWSDTLRWRLAYRFEDRDSTLPGFGYRENRIELGFTYFWGGERVPQVSDLPQGVEAITP